MFVVSREGLATRFAYGRHQYSAATFEKIATRYYQVLRVIAVASVSENQKQSLEVEISEAPAFGGYLIF